MRRNRFHLILIIVFSSMLFLGCSSSPENENVVTNGNNTNSNTNIEEGNGNDDTNNTSEEVLDIPDEITLRFWYPGDPSMVEEYLKEEFPYITFEWHDIQVVNSHRETIEEEISKNQIPDIMVLQDYSLSVLKDYDMLFDLRDLIEKHQFDINRWPEYKIKAVYAHQPDDEGLYSLPGDLTYHALAYNNEVFNKFGVSPPTDGMTWDEIIELARKVTGELDGISYRGLDIAVDAHMVGMLDDWLVNQNDEPEFENREDVRDLFSLIETVANIPGNIPDNDKTDFFDPWSYGIYTEENVAMTVHARYIALGFAEVAEDKDLDFDFVTWPIWDPENPTQPYSGGNFYSISPYSEYPDEAFKVIDYLTSDEWLEISDPLDYDLEILKDKNMEAFIRHPLNVPDHRSSAHQVTGRWLFGRYANKIVYEGIDVNTAIREAQEEAEIHIKEALGQQ